jgi:hypothetical protein
MIRFLKEYGWTMYLGGALALLEVGFTNWRYWAIMIPMIILVQLKKYNEF